MESRIFRAQRSLGYVCNEIPLQTRYIGKHRDTFIITVVGRRFYTYSAAKLHLYSISEFHPSDISCLAVDNKYVYTACKEDVRIFRRGVEADFIHKIPNVRLLQPFGSFIVAVAENVLLVFELESGEVHLEIPFDVASFKISCMAHPLSYMNKILLGSFQGPLRLINLSGKCFGEIIFEFSGWNFPVFCLEQHKGINPLDIFGIGLGNGEVILHNIRTDRTLYRFRQEWGPVTGIAFRTDMTDIMITSSNLGHLAVWNLETGRLVAQKENAHSGGVGGGGGGGSGGGVTGLKCFPFQPILATSSPDNSLRLWIMDDEVGGVRLLMFKEGHQAPPTRIRFYGEEGVNILSAGGDSSLRSFSLEAELLNFSLGKASFNRKRAKKVGVANDTMVMPAITHFAAEAVREGGWESGGVFGKEKANIVAIHEGVRHVTTWSYGRRTKCSFKLIHQRFAKNPTVLPTSLVITVCGNFCVIGYNTGHVDRFNLQSGLHRIAYGEPKAHTSAVAAVASDSLNEEVFTAGGAEVKFWNFKTGKLVDCLQTPSVVTCMQTFRDNSLAAVAMKDFSLVIVDMDIRRITRTFFGHSDVITDLTFSPDSKWLVSASLDCSIRVWDLSSASLVDCFRTVSPCLSLTFSPSGEFLASVHEKDLGIFLWTNKTVYCPTTLTAIPMDSRPEMLRLPGTAPTGEDLFPVDEEMPVERNYTSPDQLASHLLTLSLLPDFRWRNLAKQDLIRERNKPKEALKVPEKAPFFLPTIPGLEPVFDVKETSAEKATVKPLHSALRLISGHSALLDALDASNPSNPSNSSNPSSTSNPSNPSSTSSTLNEMDPLDVLELSRRPFDLLADMSPAQIEQELRLLSPDCGGSVRALKNFLRCAVVAVQDGRQQELVQSYVELFLKLHVGGAVGGGGVEGEEVVDEEFVVVLEGLRQAMGGVAKRVEELVDQSLNVVLFLKHVAL